MGDGDDGARVGGQVLLQPQDGLGVEVVGGLVEQEQVGRLDEQFAQGDAAALAAGQDGDGLVRGRAAQRVHRLVQLGVDVPRAGGIDLGLQLAHLLHEGVEVRVRVRHLLGDLVEAGELAEDPGGAQAHVLDDGLVLVQDGLLHEDADAVAGGQAGLAVARLVQSGHDLEDRGLAGAVGADHADLGSGVEGHGDVVEDDFVSDGLAGLDHLIDKLRHVSPFGVGCCAPAWAGALSQSMVPTRRRTPLGVIPHPHR